jgi:UDPglucose--hexose-1-phosphate uridylyltransferase
LAHDPACYLCPGNQRAGGAQTPDYTETFVFENDYAALRPGDGDTSVDVDSRGLLRASTESGLCRVLCFDPRHDLTLATMPLKAVEKVVEVWQAQESELGARDDIGYVQIFENRGAMMGASNPHPHGQIWATQHIPNEPALELAAQANYYAEHGTTLLADYLALELKQQERIVMANETWVAVVPFWAVWPFETILLPRSRVSTLQQMSPQQSKDLAAILQALTGTYNKLFDTPFPYSMGIHPAPCDGHDHPEWTLHLHFYPPLLRSATIRKFMVGFELLGSPQRDITPESAADALRRASR